MFEITIWCLDFFWMDNHSRYFSPCCCLVSLFPPEKKETFSSLFRWTRRKVKAFYILHPEERLNRSQIHLNRKNFQHVFFVDLIRCSLVSHPHFLFVCICCLVLASMFFTTFLLSLFGRCHIIYHFPRYVVMYALKCIVL